MKYVSLFTVLASATFITTAHADFGSVGIGALADAATWGDNPTTANDNFRLRHTATVTTGESFTFTAPNNNNLLFLGDQPNSSGQIDQDGGSWTMAGKLRLGAGNTNASGTLNLSGGSLSITQNLEMARFNTATGIANISGGILDVGQNILVGGNLIGETAIFNYDGGTVSADGQFQIGGGGVLDFQIGADPITAGQRTSLGGEGLIQLSFDSGYVHTPDTKHTILSTASASGLFLLSTDSGTFNMVDGNTATINGNEFSLTVSETELSLTSLSSVGVIPEPSQVGFLTAGLALAGVVLLRRRTS